MRRINLVNRQDARLLQVERGEGEKRTRFVAPRRRTRHSVRAMILLLRGVRIVYMMSLWRFRVERDRHHMTRVGRGVNTKTTAGDEAAATVHHS